MAAYVFDESERIRMEKAWQIAQSLTAQHKAAEAIGDIQEMNRINDIIYGPPECFRAWIESAEKTK